MERLRRLRTERGLSQAKLAARAELDPSTVNQIERGAREASPATLRKLADALDVGIADLLEDAPPKAQRRSSPEPSLFNGLEGERRESKLPEVADLLLRFGEMLLLTWEAELPDRARADDDQWLANISVLWRTFGLVNYGVLEELGAEGVRGKEAWLARYMDINATVHRINAAVREHSTPGASPDEETAVTLEPLVVA